MSKKLWLKFATLMTTGMTMQFALGSDGCLNAWVQRAIVAVLFD
ncbi:MAG: hypothetical protein SF069_03745 [Phycisphaerae bacterium]|nr:hypothetical protein [Phycisphaerae bacterium]